jgi:hypothetical protein
VNRGRNLLAERLGEWGLSYQVAAGHADWDVDDSGNGSLDRIASGPSEQPAREFRKCGLEEPVDFGQSALKCGRSHAVDQILAPQ